MQAVERAACSAPMPPLFARHPPPTCVRGGVSTGACTVANQRRCRGPGVERLGAKTALRRQLQQSCEAGIEDPVHALAAYGLVVAMSEQLQRGAIGAPDDALSSNASTPSPGVLTNSAQR